jgi:hypothetical protein
VAKVRRDSLSIRDDLGLDLERHTLHEQLAHILSSLEVRLKEGKLYNRTMI